MSMNFITIKNAIVLILQNAAAGRYQVVAAQRQKEGAKDINRLKKVTVFWTESEFDVNSGSANGDVQSDPTYQIELKVSSKGAPADSNDPDSLIGADIVADAELDGLFEIVYQILMDARNMDLGLTKGLVSKRFIKNMRKGDISEDSDMATIVGIANLTCQTAESVSGDAGVAGVGTSSDMEMNNDDFTKTKIDVPT